MASRSALALTALAVGTFALGMTEFVITGLLPPIAGDLSVSIPTAGLLISGYALSVVIGGPLLTAAVARRPRKPVLIGLLGFFVAGNLISAVAPNFAAMMTGRVVAALCHGAFIGIATIAAADLVRPDRRSSAIAAMLSGITIASVAGVPLGTLLGQQAGWRATFWAMALLGVLAALATAAFVPVTAAGDAARANWAAFRNPVVWLALGMTALAFGAVYAPFTYVAPLMTDVAGFGAGALPWLLVLFGLGLVLGNVIGARAADRHLMPTIVVAATIMLIILVAFAWTAHSRGPAAVTLFVLGVAAYATVPGLTTRVIAAADGDNLIVSAAAVSAFNLGNAAGAYLGGRAIAAGWGYDSTPLVGAGMELGALVLAAALLLVGRMSTRTGDKGRSAEVF
ncbi:MFS transporter [Actinoplanes sp. TRM 88003]|uniref:MFS transporter n=1 Tax=Paractinoplanes aksuensis TaxID=2939490 RepID=A0ABT1DRP4_9ACTN|nr:MFS transporter [Actinoplanes aksuensis]MCO8273502.1 MFS transporter [Actinoplanes aksuensis]